MATQYRLTCSCGQAHQVDQRQAGQPLACDCGKTLEVPTMRQMRSLPVVEDTTAAKPRRPWGLRQGLMLLGGVLAVVGFGLGAKCYFFAPKFIIDYDQIAIGTDHFALSENWAIWQHLRTGVISGDLKVPMLVEFQKKESANALRMQVGLALGIVGLMLLTTGLFTEASRQ